ncbi:MAG: class I SAM-dependent methyltransferase [Balneolia bacterium]|nr:class I SAM-dependent methyltransferase [Balneolia bacterium]
MNFPFRKRIRKIWHGLLEVRNALAIVKSANYRYLQFAPPGHFYSPLPDHDEVNKSASTLFDRTVASVPGIDLNEHLQFELCSRFASFRNEIPFNDEPTEANRYHFNNPYFSYGDAVVLYSMMRSFRPERIIEVGSGFSSAAMLDTDEYFFEGSTHLTFIEPFPERLDKLLTNQDHRRKQVLNKPVQQVPLSVFEQLEENDILFIDSSHVMKAGSDLSYLMFSVLPVLKPGVIIHFHDVMWPFEYPKKWFHNGRAWNEAYVLRSFLMHNKAFEILFFNSWLEEHQRSMLKRFLPLMLRQPSSKITFGNSSLWIRKK